MKPIRNSRSAAKKASPNCQWQGPEQLAGRGGELRSVDGAIVCKPGKGGDLLTKDEFENGIIRVEFKLPKAGNNGIALRTPLGGHSPRTVWNFR
jgi:hypothetical protein